MAFDLHRWAEEMPPTDGDQPRVALRVGIHAGQVLAVRDINGLANACGATINTTARIMAAAPAGST